MAVYIGNGKIAIGFIPGDVSSLFFIEIGLCAVKGAVQNTEIYVMIRKNFHVVTVRNEIQQSVRPHCGAAESLGITEKEFPEDKLSLPSDNVHVAETTPGNEKGAEAAEYALSFVGTPYLWEKIRRIITIWSKSASETQMPRVGWAWTIFPLPM